MALSIPEHGRYVEITIKPDGSLTMEPHGYGGNACQKALDPYTQGQGHIERTPTDEANTPSYLERAAETNKEQQPA